MFTYLRPGGVAALSLLNGRPDWMYDYPKEGQRKYRFNLCKPSPTAQDTDECRFHFVDSEGDSFLSVPYYHYSNETYSKVITDVGFVDLHWALWGVSQEGKEAFPAGFWKEFEEAQPCVILTARKP